MKQIQVFDGGGKDLEPFYANDPRYLPLMWDDTPPHLSTQWQGKAFGRAVRLYEIDGLWRASHGFAVVVCGPSTKTRLDARKALIEHLKIVEASLRKDRDYVDFMVRSCLECTGGVEVKNKWWLEDEERLEED